MKYVLVFAVLLLLAGAGMKMKAQNSREWVLGKSWSNGFDALPEVCTNLDEFKSQYEKNREQWDAMFSWLASHDLTAIPAGKHPIEGTNLTVSVEDSKNDVLEKRRSESHREHIDFQYVVKGQERFGLIDHATSKPNSPYKPDVIHYDYDKDKAMFIDSTPQRFFLFFPDDWHIAKIATDKEDQNIRVIVVKLDYKGNNFN